MKFLFSTQPTILACSSDTMDNHKITINAPRFKEEDDASTKLDYLYVTTVAHAHLIQSLTFNYHRGGFLSMLESKFPKDVQRLKTVINRIEDLQRLPDGGEQLYSYMQLHKEDLKQFSMLDSILKKIGTQSSVNLIEEDDVLGNMDKYTNRWPKMIKSPSDWDFFGSGSAVKLGILNGFGTGFGDIFNGNNALKIAIKMLEKRGINLEVTLFQLESIRAINVIGNEPHIHQIVQLPCPSSVMLGYDALIDLSGFVSDSEFNDRPMIDYFLERLGIDATIVTPAKKRLVLPKRRMSSKLKRVLMPLKADSPLLLIHPKASAPIRTMPDHIATKIAQAFDSNYQVCTVSSWEGQPASVKDLSKYSNSMSDLISIVASMDAIIAVDTVVTHLADSFSIPTVGLFTTINPDFRARYYPYVEGLFLGKKNHRAYGEHVSNDLRLQKAVLEYWGNLDFNSVVNSLEVMRKNRQNKAYLKSFYAKVSERNALVVEEESLRIYVVIPHYGDDALLEKCLSSLGLIPEIKNDRVIVINNNRHNVFFTRAVNEGIKKALEEKADFVWILNNDTKPYPDYLRHTLNRFSASDSVGIVGGKNLAWDHPDFICWGGSVRAFPTGKHKSGSVSNGDLNEATKEPWASFSSVVIKRDVFEKVGFLDETFEILCSDSDYCFKARLAEFEVWYEPRSVLLHKVGASGNGSKNQKIAAIMSRNIQQFHDKWFGITKSEDIQFLDDEVDRYIEENKGMLTDFSQYVEEINDVKEVRQSTVSTIIVYSELEDIFIDACIEGVVKLSEQVVVIAYKFLFNGENQENKFELIKNRNDHKNIVWKMIDFPHEGAHSSSPRYRHNYIRYQGFLELEKDSDRTLFLDADEIFNAEGSNEIAQLRRGHIKSYYFKSYWYFRSPIYQATAIENAGPVLVDTLRLKKSFEKNIDSYLSCKIERRWMLFDDWMWADGIIAHHFSWVRTKKQMLAKVKHWGHKGDRNWEALVEDEFSHEFNGTDFVHGYEYRMVENQFNIVLPEEPVITIDGKQELNRIIVSQQILDKVKGMNYFEIGVKDGSSFLPIKALNKIGVDVCLSQYLKNNNVHGDRLFEMTSDQFFMSKKDILEPESISVALVDGLHEYRQVIKDVESLLEYMKPNGVIILHDCNPTSEAYCIPALSIQEAAEKAYKLGIGPFTGWCGDVWKAIVYLRSTRKDLDIHVLDCDWGLGIISKSTGVSEVLDISIDQISKMTYSDLDNQREFLLNLKEPSYFYQFLDQNL